MSPNPSSGGPPPSHWPPGGRAGRPSLPKPPPAVQAAGAVVALALIALVVLASRGGLGLKQVAANEVAVKVNYLTGEESVITQPGYQFYMPFLQGVYTLDRTTQEYVMEGTEREYEGWPNRASRLTVRANDGSNFWFPEMRIQYELVPSKTNVVLADTGPADSFKQEWIKGHARSILRDEFGRYSAVEVANPTVYKQAPEAARARLNALLEPHGIHIVRIITPNPKFDQRYERAIEDRKEADQEVQELIARAEQLEQVREQRLAAVKKEKEVEMQTLQGELSRLLLASEQAAIRVQRGADAYAAARVAEGQAELAQLTAQAEGLTQKYTKEAEGIQSRAKALEQRGEVVVREALVEKLLGVKFTFVPYSRDPSPERLEHSGDRGPVDPQTLEGR